MHWKSSLIFDLDGTLWNSVDTCLGAWNNTLKNRNIDLVISRNHLQSILGLQHDMIADKLFPFLNVSEKQETMDEISTREIELINQKGGELYKGTETILAELAKNHKLFIVSNCQKGYIEAFLNYYSELKHLFDDFESSGNTGMRKAENIRLIIERNGLLDPIYVGDTDDDRIACEEVGIFFVYAKYGFGNVVNAKNQISDIGDLVNTKILEKLGG